jgi:hypothetical protein
MAHSKKFTCIAVSEEIHPCSGEDDFDEMMIKAVLWPIPTDTNASRKEQTDQELLDGDVFFDEDYPVEIHLIGLGGTKSEFRVASTYTLTIQKSRKSLAEIGDELEVLENAGIPQEQISELYEGKRNC